MSPGRTHRKRKGGMRLVRPITLGERKVRSIWVARISREDEQDLPSDELYTR